MNGATVDRQAKFVIEVAVPTFESDIVTALRQYGFKDAQIREHGDEPGEFVLQAGKTLMDDDDAIARDIVAGLGEYGIIVRARPCKTGVL
jgi:hypothetical protein